MLLLVNVEHKMERSSLIEVVDLSYDRQSLT